MEKSSSPSTKLHLQKYFHPYHVGNVYVKLLETLEAEENYDQHKFLSRRQEQVDTGR